MASEAVELREQGVSYSSVGQQLGVSKSQAETLVKSHPRMTCACGERRVSPVPEDACGFCISQATEERAA